MEPKKRPEADIDKKRGLFFQIGIIASLALVLIAFEWKVFEAEIMDLGKLEMEMEEEEMIPITKPEDPPPPPPPEPEIIEIVDDDEELEEELEIESTEMDEEMEIEPIEFEEEVYEEPEIFTIVEDMPAFQGCNKGSKQEKEQCTQQAIFKFLNSNIKYPQMARDAQITGVVYVNFVINEKGAITDPKVLRGIGGGCDEEAIRVVKKLPNFIPGKQRGKAVRVSYNLPIRFLIK